MEQAAGAEPTGCRVREFFAGRGSMVRVRPRPERRERKTHRLTSTRRSTARRIFSQPPAKLALITDAAVKDCWLSEGFELVVFLFSLI